MKKEKFYRIKSFNKKITIMIIILSGIIPLLSLDFIGMYTSFAQNDNNVSLSNINKTNTITPSCELTLHTVQGPYYKENSPKLKEGQKFANDIIGERLVVTGKVLDFIDCDPIQGAVLDFWQTDSDGNYDNEGFVLRGKVISDENGNYTLDTIMPGSYSDNNITRPAHIHIKAWIPENPGNPSLVTQLYFENDPFLDVFVKEPLIMNVVDINGTKFANFDFVLEDYRKFGQN
ncbi:MAG: hypothetical protein ACPKPY_00430 [Nitrososphaeraceae archaeon]